MAQASASSQLASSRAFLSTQVVAPFRVCNVAATEGQARRTHLSVVRCDATPVENSTDRRQILTAGTAALAALVAQHVGGNEAHAMLANRKAMREKSIPEEEYQTLDNGLKVYDIRVGGGRKVELGDRVTVHYVVKWKGVTFMTSREGPGVTGGTPYGFDVGTSDRGYVLKGLDLAVQGMRVGGQREVIVPPELGYGKSGIQEIPAGAILNLNVEVLSIKESPLGFQVKLVEG